MPEEKGVAGEGTSGVVPQESNESSQIAAKGDKKPMPANIKKLIRDRYEAKRNLEQERVNKIELEQAIDARLSKIESSLTGKGTEPAESDNQNIAKLIQDTVSKSISQHMVDLKKDLNLESIKVEAEVRDLEALVDRYPNITEDELKEVIDESKVDKRPFEKILFTVRGKRNLTGASKSVDGGANTGNTFSGMPESEHDIASMTTKQLKDYLRKEEKTGGLAGL